MYKNEHKILDLKGVKFTRLTALKRFRKNGRIYWKCKCDCGRSKEVSAINLRNKAVVSCGCINLVEDRGYNQILANYKSQSTKKNRSFRLTKKKFKKLLDGNCYYCNKPPLQKLLLERKNFPATIFKYNGIDRINSSLGYSDKNCRTCCKQCNIAKHNLSEAEFLEMITKIYTFRLRQNEGIQQFGRNRNAENVQSAGSR